MVVVERQRMVHVGEVEVQSLRDRLGPKPTLVDAGVNVADADATALDVRLVVDLLNDPGRLLGHLV